MVLSAGLVDARLALPRHRSPHGATLTATAGYDEDVLTLAAGAAEELLAAHPRTGPAALVLATVSSPLAEGSLATTLIEVLDLPPTTHVQEHGATVAAGGGALVAAMALVGVGLGPVLLVAADVRRDADGASVGAGAVALLLDAAGATATVTALGSTAEAFLDRWRADGDDQVRATDPSLLAFGPSRFRPADWPAADRTTGGNTVARRLDRAGDLGCAAALAGLLVAFDGSASGDCWTLVAAGNGVAHGFTVTAGARAAAAGALAAGELAGGVDREPRAAPSVDGFDPYSSQPRSWRERAQDLRLEGVRCETCGEVLYPAAPACPADGPGAPLQPYRLARRGRVLTFTRDHVFPYGAPMTMAVVDLEDGGRFFGQVVEGATVTIDSAVRLVLRRLHAGGGVPQYFYKIEPDPAYADKEAADAHLG